MKNSLARLLLPHFQRPQNALITRLEHNLKHLKI
nr:MAG TPA: hypothetical protein [Caudoviricetes sp.]